jgi:hypothetical protein
MNDMTEFQQRAVAVATIKMLSGKHFSICDLDAIAKTMGVEQQLAGRDYQALRALHCIDWADMGRDLTRQVREKCLELLGLPPAVIDVAIHDRSEAQPAPASQPSGRGLFGLPLWKRRADPIPQPPHRA